MLINPTSTRVCVRSRPGAAAIFPSLRQAGSRLHHVKASREVLIIADDVAKSYDDDKQLFTSLTFSVVVRP